MQPEQCQGMLYPQLEAVPDIAYAIQQGAILYWNELKQSHSEAINAHEGIKQPPKKKVWPSWYLLKNIEKAWL